MSESNEQIEQAWSHGTAEIPGSGLEQVREATAAERAALTAELDILSVDRLVVRYHIAPGARGRYRLTGTLNADVVQACVVTLEPVAATIEDRIDVEFRPSSQIKAEPTSAEAEAGVFEAEEHEPIEHNRIAVGRIVAETLAAALPSHPRAPGAELEQSEARPPDSAGTNPFAALAGWKPKAD